MLKVTSGKTFEDRRDHAINRVLLSGPRRQEVASMRVEHLDLASIPRTVAVVGLKGSPSRRISLGDRDVLALKRWLSHRSRHRRIRTPDQGPLWIADKTGAALTGGGIYQLLRRRAVQAAYSRDAVRPHLFRHAMAHEALASGRSEAEGDGACRMEGSRDGGPLWREHGRAARAGGVRRVRLHRPLLSPAACRPGIRHASDCRGGRMFARSAPLSARQRLKPGPVPSGPFSGSMRRTAPRNCVTHTVTPRRVGGPLARALQI